ncbi:LamG-like jellyroll fold domain-containing protein [Amycolatopsis sp. WGS_07]|uniref:LamG-like jellyroll fold domain-containing protein n=1 Tax=Amycolatopsis sp. WGS_07 TaxID=3076764 RepID=UPI0038730C8D
MTEAAALARAAATGVSVEATASTTETRQVIANPSGTFTMTTSARPVRVRRGNGWAPIDLTLVRGSDGSVAPVASATPVVFSGGGSAPLARVTAGTAGMSLSWPGSLPAPVLSQNTATYTDVLPGVDLVLSADIDGYSEVLVVETAAAGANPGLRTLRFGVATTGVRTARDTAGNLDFLDDRGEVVFHAPAPSMWDSGGTSPGKAIGSGEDAVHRPMGVEVSADAVTLVPDAAMLGSARTRFPVYIDPSVSAGRRAWTTVWQKFPSTSYWNSSENIARVGHESDEGNTNRSFFWMATDAVNGKHILSATFRANNVYSWSCAARPVDLWLTGAINSHTTWNSQPTWMRKLASANQSRGYSSSCPGGYLEFNALSAVQQQARSGWPGVTLGLRASETDTFGWKKFKASDTAIVIEYNSVPNAPTSVSTGENKPCVIGESRPVIGTTTPVLRATLRDADRGQNLRARFQWWIANGAMKGEFLTSPQNPLSTTFSVPIPVGAFADRDNISWRVRAEDGTDAGPFGPWCEYHVDTVHPDRTPSVSSADFPSEGIGNGVGRPGSFTLGPNGVTDVVAYLYAFDSDDPKDGTRLEATGAGGAATVRYTPGFAGDHRLTVWSVDRAGNTSRPSQYFFVVGSATPVAAQWLFDDNSPADSSPTGTHPLTLPASGTSWAEGKQGGGLAFTGGAAATAAAVADTSKSLTFSAWVSLSTTDSAVSVMSFAGTRTSALSLQHMPNSPTWLLTATSADSIGTAATTVQGGKAEAGVWTHLTGVFDTGATGRQLRLYVNGSLAGTAALPSLWQAGAGVYVGSSLRGVVDSARIWDRALTDDEIASVADDAVLMGHWAFDEGSGTSVADSSGHGRTVTLTGATFVERPPGYAAMFNGTGDFAATAGPVLRTDSSYTVTAWVRLRPGTSDATAVSAEGSKAGAFELQYRVATGKWSFTVTSADAAGAAATRVESTGPAVDPGDPEGWVFLTASYDAPHKALRLYVNGEGPVTAAAPATVWNASGPVRIGAVRTGAAVSAYWPGAVDDVRLLSGVLTTQQVRDLFTA